MTLLQKFGFKQSGYQRPQDKWLCGRLAEGRPCGLGPGLDGRCRVTTACQPRQDENGRWECRRSPQEGGPCEAGPFPDGHCAIALERCTPRPSLRTRRKRAALWATTLAVGILALLIGGGPAKNRLMPGALSADHATLTDCAACHAGIGTGNLDWLHRLVASAKPAADGKLCLACHDRGPQPFAPHGYPVAALKRLTQVLGGERKATPAAAGTWLQRLYTSVTFQKPATGNTEIYCATCHAEHQGLSHDLTMVSNARCQACHVARFGAFATTHPEFTRYPYERRPRIVFDHQSHYRKYFPDAVKTAAAQPVPTECTDCHVAGARQRFMQVKSFDAVCASCHQGDIRGNQTMGPKGVAFLSVPGLDVAALRARGIDIGEWPEAADAGLTPFMRLLLSVDDGKAVAGVGKLDLLDLRQAGKADLAKVATLAWAVKRLFRTLETTTLPTALGLTSGGGELDPTLRAELTGALPHDVITAANRAWFPHLQDDLQRHDNDEPTRSFKPPAIVSTAKPITPAAPAASDKGSDNILAPSTQPKSAEDILGPAAPAKPADDILAPSTPAKSSDDILAPSAPAKSADDILAPSSPAKSGNADSLLGGSNQSGNPLLPQKTPAKPAVAKRAPKPFDPESWAASGGWYRQDFAIRYRPAVHTDRFLKAWLDFSGNAHSAKPEAALAAIFARLSAKDGIGRCSKCHSIDSAAGTETVAWRPFNADGVQKRFTTFSHKQHIAAVGEKGCQACHVLKQGGDDFLKSYAQRAPEDYTPNFQPMRRALCARCHAQQTTWQACTLCHNYHVDSIDARAAETLGGTPGVGTARAQARNRISDPAVCRQLKRSSSAVAVGTSAANGQAPCSE